MSNEGRSEPIITITGEHVALGPEQRDLLPLYNRWTNDFAMLRTLVQLPAPVPLDTSRARYEQRVGSDREIRFTIYERPDLRPIGTTLLGDIDYRSGTAEYVILIGEAGCRGKGYGTETTRLMLDYAFTALGLHSVMLTVFSFNIGGQRAYAKAGFREIGRRREGEFMGGKWWDVLYMAIWTALRASS